MFRRPTLTVKTKYATWNLRKTPKAAGGSSPSAAVAAAAGKSHHNLLLRQDHKGIKPALWLNPQRGLHSRRAVVWAIGEDAITLLAWQQGCVTGFSQPLVSGFFLFRSG